MKIVCLIYFRTAQGWAAFGPYHILVRRPSGTYAMVLRKCFVNAISTAAHTEMNECSPPSPQQLQRVNGGRGVYALRRPRCWCGW